MAARSLDPAGPGTGELVQLHMRYTWQISAACSSMAPHITGLVASIAMWQMSLSSSRASQIVPCHGRVDRTSATSIGVRLYLLNYVTLCRQVNGVHDQDGCNNYNIELQEHPDPSDKSN